MSVKLVSSSGGSVTLQEPVTASDFTVTVPDATTTLVGTDNAQVLTNKVINGGALQSATAQATTSGTFKDFTGIPSWVKRITVMFNGVSISAQAAPYIQLGGSGGFENSGYSSIAGSISTASNTTSATVTTTYFGLYSGTIGSTEFVTGNVIFTNISGNTWTCNASLFSGNRSVSIGGAKSLSDVLTQIRISTSTGNFDAGSINILYE